MDGFLIVTNWDEACNRVSSPGEFIPPKKGSRFNLSSNSRIAITGASGAGKTELFRYLTGEAVPYGSSTNSDESYQKYKKFAKNLALITIPGQTSKERHELTSYIFGGGARLDGVIHMFSYGFNEIWPKEQPAFMRNLKNKTLLTVRSKNLTNEFGDLKDTLEHLSSKIFDYDKELRPKWMLILVSKVDLYWNDIDSARGYYHPQDACKKHPTLKEHLKKFIANYAEKANMEVVVLPIALDNRDYTLEGIDINIDQKSHLNDSERTALNSAFFETLERLLHEY